MSLFILLNIILSVTSDVLCDNSGKINLTATRPQSLGSSQHFLSLFNLFLVRKLKNRFLVGIRNFLWRPSFEILLLVVGFRFGNACTSKTAKFNEDSEKIKSLRQAMESLYAQRLNRLDFISAKDRFQPYYYGLLIPDQSCQTYGTPTIYKLTSLFGNLLMQNQVWKNYKRR